MNARQEELGSSLVTSGPGPRSLVTARIQKESNWNVQLPLFLRHLVQSSSSRREKVRSVLCSGGIEIVAIFGLDLTTIQTRQSDFDEESRQSFLFLQRDRPRERERKKGSFVDQRFPCLKGVPWIFTRFGTAAVRCDTFETKNDLV